MLHTTIQRHYTLHHDLSMIVFLHVRHMIRIFSYAHMMHTRKEHNNGFSNTVYMLQYGMFCRYHYDMCYTVLYPLVHAQYIVDVDECEAGIGDCDQHCYNTIGSFFCSCDSSYSLGSDGKTCIIGTFVHSLCMYVCMYI